MGGESGGQGQSASHGSQPALGRPHAGAPALGATTRPVRAGLAGALPSPPGGPVALPSPPLERSAVGCVYGRGVVTDRAWVTSGVAMAARPNRVKGRAHGSAEPPLLPPRLRCHWYPRSSVCERWNRPPAPCVDVAAEPPRSPRC